MKYYIYEYFGSYGICREDQIPIGAIIVSDAASNASDLYDELRELKSNLG